MKYYQIQGKDYARYTSAPLVASYLWNILSPSQLQHCHLVGFFGKELGELEHQDHKLWNTEIKIADHYLLSLAAEKL